jgi:photosystem II stability/assembly factor-like uncharacterized protein
MQKHTQTLLLLLLPLTLMAQWRTANGPYGGMIWDMKGNGSAIFATQSNGIFRSYDAGATWQQCDTAKVHHLTVQGQQIVLVSYNHRYLRRSNDNGQTWNTHFLPDNLGIIRDWAVLDSVILLSANTGLWRSVNGGASWSQLALDNAGDELYNAIETVGQQFYVTNRFRVYRSSDGLQWTYLSTVPEPLTFTFIFQIAGHDSTLLVFTGPRLYFSNDKGQKWKQSLLPQGMLGTLPPIFYNFNKRWYAASNQLLYSDDAGETWQIAPGNQPHTFDLWTMSGKGDTILCGSLWNGVWRSTDSGQTLHPANKGLSGSTVMEITRSGDSLLVCHTEGISATTVPAFAWNATRTLPVDVNGVLFYDFIIRPDGWLLREGTQKLWRSTDAGHSWQNITPALSINIMRVVEKSDTLLLLDVLGEILHSTDGGTSWERLGKPERFADDVAIQGKWCFFSGAGGQLFRSATLGNWQSSGELPVPGARLAATAQYLLAIPNDTQPDVFISADQGTTWQKGSLPWPPLYQMTRERRINFAVYNNVLLASFEGAGVFYSSNKGISWSPFNTGLPDIKFFTDTHFSPDWLVCGTGAGVFYRDIQDVLVLSASDLSETQLMVYPNPVMDVVVVPNPVPGTFCHFQLFSMSGMEVMSVRTKEPIVYLNMQQLPKGAYQLIATDGQRRKTTTLIRL